MSQRTLPACCLLLVAIGSTPAFGQLRPEMMERGKKATALVEVAARNAGATGTAFCVDESGLFITNAHVIRQAVDGEGQVRLVLGIGTKAQRAVPARIVRHDDRLDLALLEVEEGPHPAVLELAKASDVKELARVFTFGYPFGKDPVVGGALYPDVTILPSQITALIQAKGELVRVQFDNQINPGNSGGPVVDESGRVVGVAVETKRGAELNRAIPVGQLAQFLSAPGVVCDPPPFDYFTRDRPVKWTIRLVPPKPRAQLAPGLSVAVTLADGTGRPRSHQARAIGDGTFEATLAAVPREPDWRVDVSPTPMPAAWVGNPLALQVPDQDVRGGGTRFMLSVLRKLRAGRPLRAPEKQAAPGSQQFLRLGKATKKIGWKSETIDLNRVETLDVWARSPSGVYRIQTVVEAKDGSRVLATVGKNAVLTAPRGLETGLRPNVIVVITPRPDSPPKYSRPPVDQGLLKLGGVLDLDGIPRGAAASIRPAQAAIPEARLTEDKVAAATPALERKLAGKISDVVPGGGGRYLLLLLKEEQKIAVFDANVADVVKTINLPSPNAMVAAGAARFLIAYPDEKLIQCWKFASLEVKGAMRPSPIGGRLKALALGSDSEGPALCLWSNEGPFVGAPDTQFSFLDLDSLAVLRVGLIAASGARGSISTTGGSFRISNSASDLSDRAHLRASAGGALFGIWPTARTLSVLGKAVLVVDENTPLGHLAPGLDGHTLFTGLIGPLNTDLKRPGSAVQPHRTAPVVSMPSSDPSYFLTVSGLPDFMTGVSDSTIALLFPPPGAPVTASVHATVGGSRLLGLGGLDEMQVDIEDRRKIMNESSSTDFTLDKRFHLIPQAHLFITIPRTNDRLVLRRLDIKTALARSPENYLIVTSASNLAVRAGGKLEHRVVALSKHGGIDFALASGPAGMNVAPEEGRLTWEVPQALAGEDVTAVVRVRDLSGQERSHQLRIRIE
jgi:hypothetical protein